MIRSISVLFFVLQSLLVSSEASSVSVAATYDADTYFYTQTYNEVRTSTNAGTLHVGQHNLNSSSIYNGHFNFGAVSFSDLSLFTAGQAKFLQLNVKDFKTPMAVDPSYQGPPKYEYLGSGNFRLAIVALTAPFTLSETTNDLQGWYNTNLYSRLRIAERDITSLGVLQIDVTSAVDGWISAPATNFGFGLIGLSSTPEATTVRFYSMESAGNLGPLLIPEPNISLMLWVALSGWLLGRKRFCH